MPIRRRIVPQLVTDTRQPGNIRTADAHSDIQQRYQQANEAIYIKYNTLAAKKRGGNKHQGHGSHHEHLTSLKDYMVHYLKLTKHKGSKVSQTEYDYLKQQFEKKRYYSSKTKRFRKF